MRAPVKITTAAALAGKFCPFFYLPVWAIRGKTANPNGPNERNRPDTGKMDKVAGLREILALDPKNSFARYGIAIELASRGEIDAAISEFDTLLANDPDYTPGYFMSAQTLAGAGKRPEAIGRLRAGIACAARCGNSHALNEMQTMLGEMEMREEPKGLRAN
jgi:predicted Zn-dependent protease